MFTVLESLKFTSASSYTVCLHRVLDLCVPKSSMLSATPKDLPDSSPLHYHDRVPASSSSAVMFPSQNYGGCQLSGNLGRRMLTVAELEFLRLHQTPPSSQANNEETRDWGTAGWRSTVLSARDAPVLLRGRGTKRLCFLFTNGSGRSWN